MPHIKQICKITGEEFLLSEWEQEFLKKIDMPIPTLCPDERQKKRLVQRNERSLYKRICDLCKKTMIAMYPESAPFPVYCSDCWWGDEWDPMQYGMDFDFSRPFFEQFQELYMQCPRVGVLTRNSENSEYTNCEEHAKNCYLTFGGGYSQDCMYCHFCVNSKDCIDSAMCERCELCYECLELENCYHCMYLQNSINSSDCFLSSDLIGCKNCFGCSGLRNKEYHIFNEAYAKEDYEGKIKSLIENIHSNETKSKFKELCAKIPVKFSRTNNCENCRGDYILNSQNCWDCYDVRKCKDCMHIYWGEDVKDCYDGNVIYVGTELVYNSQSICLSCSFVRCSNFCWNVSFVDYSDYCHYSNNLFGCVSLKRKEYCILNKQYSKEEFESLKKRIIEHMKSTGEWGEFWSFAPFAYNETMAQIYLPMTKEEVLSRAYGWLEEDKKNYQMVTDAIACFACSKVFKYMPKELKFYEQMSVSKPLKCHDCRYKDRMTLRNPRRLWTRNCAKCKVEIKTSYSPERPEKVYCESCYLADVY